MPWDWEGLLRATHTTAQTPPPTLQSVTVCSTEATISCKFTCGSTRRSRDRAELDMRHSIRCLTAECGTRGRCGFEGTRNQLHRQRFARQERSKDTPTDIDKMRGERAGSNRCIIDGLAEGDHPIPGNGITPIKTRYGKIPKERAKAASYQDECCPSLCTGLAGDVVGHSTDGPHVGVSNVDASQLPMGLSCLPCASRVLLKACSFTRGTADASSMVSSEAPGASTSRIAPCLTDTIRGDDIAGDIGAT